VRVTTFLGLELNRLLPTAVFGEQCLQEGVAWRTAQCIAMSDTICLRLPKSAASFNLARDSYHRFYPGESNSQAASGVNSQAANFGSAPASADLDELRLALRPMVRL
jgi:hypothetical protein